MGYFSNGTEGDLYQQEFCNKCVHDQADNCPILLIHLIYNYDQGERDERSLAIQEILGLLIPRDPQTGWNLACSMFVPTESLRGD